MRAPSIVHLSCVNRKRNNDVRSGMIINDITVCTHEASSVRVLRHGRATPRGRRVAPLVRKHGLTETTTTAHPNHS